MMKCKCPIKLTLVWLLGLVLVSLAVSIIFTVAYNTGSVNGYGSGYTEGLTDGWDIGHTQGVLDSYLCANPEYLELDILKDRGVDCTVLSAVVNDFAIEIFK